MNIFTGTSSVSSPEWSTWIAGTTLSLAVIFLIASVVPPSLPLLAPLSLLVTDDSILFSRLYVGVSLLDMRILRARVEMGENSGFVTELLADARGALGRRVRGRGTGICDLRPYSSASPCLDEGLTDEDLGRLPYSSSSPPPLLPYSSSLGTEYRIRGSSTRDVAVVTVGDVMNVSLDLGELPPSSQLSSLRSLCCGRPRSSSRPRRDISGVTSLLPLLLHPRRSGVAARLADGEYEYRKLPPIPYPELLAFSFID